MKLYVLHLFMAVSLVGFGQVVDTTSDLQGEVDEKLNLQQLISKHSISKKDLTILIDKSDYTLAVWHADSALITYPCVFGFNSVDDKFKEGDGCTPEGDFGIRSMYSHRSWNYFIWIDYPNKESWSKFKQRKSDGEIAEYETIGGEIGIHGVPEGMDELIPSKTNWTLGCISLSNSDIDDLFHSINSSAHVKIIR